MCTPWKTKRSSSFLNDRMPLQRRMLGPSVCTRFCTHGKNLSGSSGFSVLSDSSGLFREIRVLGESPDRSTYISALRSNLRQVLEESAASFNRVVIHTSFKLRYEEIDAIRRTTEEIASAKAKYEQTQATLEKFEHGNRREDVDLAQAAYSYDEARFRERQVVAPTSATVEVLDVRPGDLIAPNTPVATLLENDQIYVRIYIPETEISRVKVGQKAEVRLDTTQNEVIDGVVEQINQQAEFLPRNVQTRDERVHQVIGVKVRINDTSGHVLAGMAADVKLKTGS